MPVQETIDATEELGDAGFRLGAIIVNRARPTLVGAGQVAHDGSTDVQALRHGLDIAGIDASFAQPLATQFSEYAERQRVQSENELRLDAVDLPRVVLPDLNPPVELGELNELAGYLLAPDGESSQ
jgi:hypothetical protein